MRIAFFLYMICAIIAPLKVSHASGGASACQLYMSYSCQISQKYSSGSSSGIYGSSNDIAPFASTFGSSGGSGNNFLSDTLGLGSSGNLLGGDPLGGGLLGGGLFGSGLGPDDSFTPASNTPAPATGSLAGGGAIGDLLCSVVYWFTGSLGQGIATLAVTVLGIGALMGKVSQGTALTTMVGISVMFGAPNIVRELTGQSACYSGGGGAGGLFGLGIRGNVGINLGGGSRINLGF